ncbi:MAG: AAA family ATPase [Desulfuromonadaceae bacterium]|nr:AAA family ATPase [Desulfuromonadaceae bacterium]
MKTITIGNSKGGVGKSTLACNLAVAVARDGKKVVIVDADVQGSSLAFREIRESDDIGAVSITTPTIHKDITRLNADLVIVDAGGRDSAAFRSAVVASDLFIIPILPSLYDFWATSDTCGILDEARTYKDIQARLLINQYVPGTVLARDIEQALAEFADKAALMQARIPRQEVFKRSLVKGSGVQETDSRGKAAAAVKALYDEIISIIQ